MEVGVGGMAMEGFECTETQGVSVLDPGVGRKPAHSRSVAKVVACLEVSFACNTHQ